MASLITEVVTARGAIPGVPAAKGHATVHRIAKAQMALVGVSGDILRVHGDLVEIGRETSGLDLHECPAIAAGAPAKLRSEEHTSELQSLMRISYAVFCLKKKTTNTQKQKTTHNQINQNQLH